MATQEQRNDSPQAEDSEAAQIRSLDRPPNPYRLSFSHGAAIRPNNNDSPRPRRRKGVTSATGSSESGTEADDETENRSFVKALPAPNTRPRKGLKAGENDEALLTPSQLDDEGRIIEGEGYFPTQYASEVEEKDVLFKRRLNEFARRCSEAVLMAAMLLVVLCGRGVWTVVKTWKFELLAHLLIMVGLVAAYPVKLSVIDTRSAKSKLWQRFRVPASFDPATVLYPPLLPVMVALTVSPINSTLVLPNITLGLSSLPQRLFPRSTRFNGFNTVHWLISVLPLVIGSGVKWLMSITSTQDLGFSNETLVSLYPLHHALLQPLLQLTTNSLLISEQHLLSVALINLLLFARAPQSTILKACLWIGGVTLYALTDRVLHWNVTLARVPRWKLRRPGHGDAERRSLIDAVADVVNLQRAAKALQAGKRHYDSDADEDYDPNTPITKTRNPRLQQVLDQDQQPIVSDDSSIKSTVRSGMPRRHTIPGSKPQQGTQHQRSRKPTHIPWCLQLTPAQADRRKVAYAAFTYAAVVGIILVPIRVYVSRRALYNAEPIGWAISYLFGQIPQVADIVHWLGLTFWVPLPTMPTLDFALSKPALPLDIRGLQAIVGPANTHLLLIAYWVIVLTAGLLAVFTLTPYVEVDTRRKVFHGVMVAMFLPATFVDPCYCALALSLVLTVFLLLEVIRAAQVPPLGTAIGRFIAPYVDGRDLRGPVVVSHLFLAIGCAVPLWFSLAGLRRQHIDIWKDWETLGQARDVGMLAGVICVGMGDAAASLIGRRYGRRKWLWVGGKSLEGSAAFAVAVTLGLLFGKIWLWLGNWNDVEPIQHGMLGWTFWLIKAAICACGASFLEAVLTGANDNVACPICLWLLVKGMRL